MLLRVLLVCLAGAVGTGLRYLVSLGAGRLFGARFPYGTLIVNLVGCFFIAAIVHASLTTSRVSDTWRLVLTTGLMGGLTTYSSFNLETTTLLRDGSYGLAALNASVTLGGCFVAGLLGLVAARAAFGS
ncbi:MAG TPA: fluoride efflux transporter CrcB [Polyangiaceae bacterium]|jgi:CrcB protein